MASKEFGISGPRRTAPEEEMPVPQQAWSVFGCDTFQI